MHLGPAVVSSSSLFSASVQHQMTALISLTQGLNKTTGVQRSGTRWTLTRKHKGSPSSNHYMLFLCLLYSLTLNLTISLSLTLMRSGKCLSLLVICLALTIIASLLWKVHPVWSWLYECPLIFFIFVQLWFVSHHASGGIWCSYCSSIFWFATIFQMCKKIFKACL